MDVVAQHERIAETFDGYPWTNDTTIHPGRSRRSLAEETRAYLDTHYDAPLCLADLGKRVGVSPFTLLRRFRASVGLSPHEYQTLRRIDHAKRLLRSGETIARAAVAVGYCDQSHLTRHFQQIVGLTPGAYGRLQ